MKHRQLRGRSRGWRCVVYFTVHSLEEFQGSNVGITPSWDRYAFLAVFIQLSRFDAFLFGVGIKLYKPQQAGRIHALLRFQKLEQSVYEENLHKCPSCGEIIKSFEANCPACGYEFRDAKASGVVREFAQKLEALEWQRSERPKKRNNSTTISKTDQQIITLIRSFPIPNTKEDLFECLILVSSNIDMQRHYDIDGVSEDRRAISDAWEAKFEQAYNKAKLSFSREPEFIEMQAIHKQKKAEINRAIKAYCVVFLVCWHRLRTSLKNYCFK